MQLPRAEELGDVRVRRAIEDYVHLVGGRVVMLEDHVAALELPNEERVTLIGSADDSRDGRILVAYALEALERYPEAEMAAVGSRILERMTGAARARGLWIDRGTIPADDVGSSQVPIKLEHAELLDTQASQAVRWFGRICARLAVSGGGELKESLETSAILDLVTGAPADPAIRERCTPEGIVTTPTEARSLPTFDVAAFDVMVADLKSRVESTAEQMRQQMQKQLSVELDRLQRYYARLVEDGSDVDAVEAEQARRSTEERRRHEVTVESYPVQLEAWSVPVQQVTWTLRSPEGTTGELTGSSAMLAGAKWTIVCPTCLAWFDTATMCSDGHAVCIDCVERCGVCARVVCAAHQGPPCHVDPHPVCTEDTFLCPSCSESGCKSHVSICATSNHAACSLCVSGCQRCKKLVCNEHAVRTAQMAPRGTRRLCPECTVLCEGGSGEPVGVDEAVGCDSCERWVCTAHATQCEVDGRVHCSSHLRRTDRSRKLVCERHRSACGMEPESVFATEELTECTKCGRHACADHGGVCAVDDLWMCSDHSARSKKSGRLVCTEHMARCDYEDGAFAADEVHECCSCGKEACDQHSEVCVGHGVHFCMAHLAPLLDTNGDFGCEEHRRQCHVDDRTYSLSGVQMCPVCNRSTCHQHVVKCDSCGRAVCKPDRSSKAKECRTCERLEEQADPDDDLIAASLVVNDGEPIPARSWFVAQDAGHRVVKLELGWGRSVVFTLTHGARRPTTIVRHGLFSRKSVR